ncbi:hypothetical protein CCH79_00002494 [Gambusia affinis]|uniref:Uncharacterized protein n=1 Tax=Gambusia affinis TaxID=33528 RepID=A0A315VJ07_GAMAF|nr:hypothetical protein CCH79_00002494 [Gambusia affinis]
MMRIVEITSTNQGQEEEHGAVNHLRYTLHRSCCPSLLVALLDINESAAERLLQALEQHFGAEKTIFLKCDVESEEQIRVILEFHGACQRPLQAASEASGYGVRFNAVCPGFVQTDLMTNIPVRLGQFSNLAAATHKLVDVMGTIAVSDVAAAALELLTDDTKNGEALLVLQSGATYMQFPSFNPTQNKPL